MQMPASPARRAIRMKPVISHDILFVFVLWQRACVCVFVSLNITHMFSWFVCVPMQLMMEYINSNERYLEYVRCLTHYIIALSSLTYCVHVSPVGISEHGTTIHLCIRTNTQEPAAPGSKSAPLSRIICSIISSQFMCQLCVI